VATFLAPVSAFTAGFLTFFLACLLIIKKDRGNPLNRAIAFVLLIGSVMQTANGMAVVDSTDVALWRSLVLICELLLPAALLYTGLALMRVAGVQGEMGAHWRAHAVAVIGAGLGILAWSEGTFQIKSGLVTLGPLGRVDYIFIVFTLALGLAQLEQILRGARDPFRYQLKFIVIGLGAFAGYKVYESSRLLLFPVWQPDGALVDSLVTVISIALVIYGLRRVHVQEVKVQVYVAPQVLYGSVTFLVIGLYLFAVGVVGELLRYTDQSLGSALSTLVIFLAVVGLVVVLSSRTARSSLKRTISRYFYRVKYDYRSKWLELTEAFRSCASVDAILDRFLDVLSATFGAGRISIWIRFEADGRFHQVRTINTESAPPPMDLHHPLIQKLVDTEGPLGLEELKSARNTRIDDCFWTITRAVLCVPLRSDNRLMGFVTLSQERGAAYGTDDADLLRAIAYHVAMLVSLAELAEERRAASELDALHRFSAFCLHDIKNLAARLSLVIQNAEVYGQDPAFQQSAMRTVSTTVQKMTALIAKLSPGSRAIPATDEGQWEVFELQAVLSETVDSLNGGLRVPIRIINEPLSPVRMKRDQIQQVLLNVILNAQQACGEHGAIEIRTSCGEGSAIITISDNGSGISPSVLRTLFHPFQTTKKEGFGVGLYECKRIVEAHEGTMCIESQVGHGTTVRITLPFASEINVLSEVSHTRSQAEV
jgi:putative PEP-CTERM system histidine kinase